MNAKRPKLDRDPWVDERWARAMQGDRAAVDDLVKYLCGPGRAILRGFLPQKLGCPTTEALDLTAIGILAKINEGNLKAPRGHALATLLRWIKNSVKELKRFFNITPKGYARPRDYSEVKEDFLEDRLQPNPADALAESSEQSDQVVLLAKEIEALSPQLRIMLRLYSVGMPEIEIAVKVGMSHDAVRQAISRAITGLREKMRRESAA